jgi:hypothetical protein
MGILIENARRKHRYKHRDDLERIGRLRIALTQGTQTLGDLGYQPSMIADPRRARP